MRFRLSFRVGATLRALAPWSWDLEYEAWRGVEGSSVKSEGPWTAAMCDGTLRCRNALKWEVAQRRQTVPTAVLIFTTVRKS